MKNRSPAETHKEVFLLDFHSLLNWRVPYFLGLAPLLKPAPLLGLALLIKPQISISAPPLDKHPLHISLDFDQILPPLK